MTMNREQQMKHTVVYSTDYRCKLGTVAHGWLWPFKERAIVKPVKVEGVSGTYITRKRKYA